MERILQNKGQVAFVTGAGSGIGRAIAKKFAVLGASVIVADLNLTGAEETVAMLDNPTGQQKHAAVRLDVTKKDDVAAVMAWVGENYGKLDILMNNAGVSSMHHLVDLEEKDWDLNFDVNAKGVFLVTQAAAPLLRDGGRIVNTCSMAAVKPDPTLPPLHRFQVCRSGFDQGGGAGVCCPSDHCQLRLPRLCQDQHAGP